MKTKQKVLVIIIMKTLIILTTILFTITFFAPVSAQSGQKPELIVQTGHVEAINSLTFSSNEKQLISSSIDETSKIWDIESSRELKTFSRYLSPSLIALDVGSVQAVSRDGRTLLVKGSGGGMKLWSIGLGKEVQIFSKRAAYKLQNSEIPEKVYPYGGTLVFSPDSKTIAGINKADITFWDVVTGNEVKSIKGVCDKNCEVETFAFSPDGKILAAVVKEFISNAYAWHIKLWDVELNKVLRQLDAGKYEIDNSVFRRLDESSARLIFSPDGKTLASRGVDKSIKLWNTESGKILLTLETGSIAFSPNNRTLLVQYGNTVKLLSATSGQELSILGKISDISGQNILEYVVFSPNGEFLVTVSNKLFYPSIVKLWNAATGKEVQNLPTENIFVSAVTFSPDGTRLVSWNKDRVRPSDSTIVWDVSKGQILRKFNGHHGGASAMKFSASGEFIVSGGRDGEIKLWEIATGKNLKVFQSHSNSWFSKRSPDGRLLVLGYSLTSSVIGGAGKKHDYKLWNLYSNEGVKTLNFDKSVDASAFSPDGRILATSFVISVSPKIDSRIKLWDTRTAQELRVLSGVDFVIDDLKFSPDGKILIAGSNFWHVSTGRNISNYLYPNRESELLNQRNLDASLIYTFSPDGRLLAVVDRNGLIRILQLETEKIVCIISRAGDEINNLAFSLDGKILLSAGKFTYGKDDVKLWSVASGEKIKSFSYTDEAEIVAIVPAFRDYGQSNDNSDNQIRIEVGANGKINLFETKSNKLLANLFVIDENSWAVVTPDGRFDTNKLEKPEGLHWLMPDAPLTPLSFEVFMRDYFEPNLLPRLLKCTEESNCDQEFKSIRDLSSLNRTQPKIKITKIAPTTSADTVQVSAEVENTTSEYQKDSQGKNLSSGVYDVRLFRDGQLVGYSTSDEKLRSTFRTYKNFGEELAVWREANRVDLANGKRTFIFKVKLPNNPNNQPIEFSAYAFNDDRVKSETARATYNHEQPSQKIEPRKAYVIAFGVNKSQNPTWNLQFAAKDAQVTQKILSKKLRERAEFSEVIEISLISDDKYQDATKENVQAVFDLLSGKTPSAERLKKLGNIADKLPPAKPDDAVFILFSSHGYGDTNGVFYILPSNIGADSGRTVTPVLLKNSISSDELSLWLRDVDAGEMVMIIDACNAEWAVKNNDFKPAPMGSRGLGQLAFDKGMKILTATQAVNVANEIKAIKEGNEIKKIEQGLLTYALIQEGLEDNAADFKAKDKIINLKEWLEFAEFRVPTLYEKWKEGKPKDIVSENPKTEKSVQQPYLFDFTRKKKDFILARLP